jgi:hypothetical protein
MRPLQTVHTDKGCAGKCLLPPHECPKTQQLARVAAGGVPRLQAAAAAGGQPVRGARAAAAAPRAQAVWRLAALADLRLVCETLLWDALVPWVVTCCAARHRRQQVCWAVLVATYALASCRSNDANRQGFERTMDEVNAALTQQPGPYFLDDFSLVDCVFAPFLERIGAHDAFCIRTSACCTTLCAARLMANLTIDAVQQLLPMDLSECR